MFRVSSVGFRVSSFGFRISFSGFSASPSRKVLAGFEAILNFSTEAVYLPRRKQLARLKLFYLKART